jgi:hypothetical protein
MKACFCGMVFNGDFILEEVIRTFQPYGKVVFVEGPVKYYRNRGFTTSLDDTNNILARTIGSENIIHGQWEEKDDEARAVSQLIPLDTDFVWWIDSDEVYHDETFDQVLELLQTNQYDGMSFKAISFYGGFDRVMTGFEAEFEVHRIQRWYPNAVWASHRPPTVLAPDGRPWRDHRYLNHHETAKRNWFMYHYSYVLPSVMKAKSEYYHTWTQTIPDYFNRVYLPWVTGNAAKKTEIESAYQGVHDWLPQNRGDCYTAKFTGSHPREIEKSLAKLKQRVNDEILLYAVRPELSA